MTSPKKLEMDYVRRRAEAARWLHERQEYAQWWGWAVLTGHNPDSTTLNLPDTVAFNIFTDLAGRGLLVPFLHEGHEVFKLNLGDQAAWERVMNPPGLMRLWVWRPAGLALRKTGWVMLLILWTGITAAVTTVVTKSINEGTQLSTPSSK